MPSTNNQPNLCVELKQSHNQLLDLKKEFDTLMADMNSLRPNFSKNMPEIKTNISKLQDSRAQIEEKMFEMICALYINSDQAQTLIKKYVPSLPRILSRIEKKIAFQQDLSPIELTILYDIKDKIIPVLSEEQKQKIKEIRDKRVHKTDAPIVFACQPNEIAWGENEVNENTKAYIGPFFPGIFTILSHLEHIYTAFPEGKIRKHYLEIGGRTNNQLIQELNAKNIEIREIDDMANDLLNNKDFTTSSETKNIELVRLTVEDLGFPSGATTKQIYQKAEELGLYLCPAQVGPHFRLQYSGREWIMIAMKQIIDSGGNPCVFYLNSNDEGLEFDAIYAKPVQPWHSGCHWVFSSRKLDS